VAELLEYIGPQPAIFFSASAVILDAAANHFDSLAETSTQSGLPERCIQLIEADGYGSRGCCRPTEQSGNGVSLVGRGGR
jgi:hypothetical protein